jgi:hypothetical protein
VLVVLRVANGRVVSRIEQVEIETLRRLGGVELHADTDEAEAERSLSDATGHSGAHVQSVGQRSW